MIDFISLMTELTSCDMIVCPDRVAPVFVAAHVESELLVARELESLLEWVIGCGFFLVSRAGNSSSCSITMREAVLAA